MLSFQRLSSTFTKFEFDTIRALCGQRSNSTVNFNSTGGKGKGDREKGSGKKGKKGRDDDDYVPESDRMYLANTGGATGGGSAGSAAGGLGGIMIVTNTKEKEIAKVEKKIREVERLEQQLAEGKNIDALQQKKIDQKMEFMLELERLLCK